MPSNLLLLLPLLGGYWFIHAFYYSRIRAQSLDGNRLLLDSIAAGMLLCLASFGVVLVTGNVLPTLRTTWHTVGPHIPYLATVIGGTVMGLVLPYLLNGLGTLFGFPYMSARRAALARYGNELQRTLTRAAEDEMPISVTLDNRKTYVGLVGFVPTLNPNDQYFSIIPFFSGYREKDTLDLFFTVDYLDVYKRAGVDQNKFLLVLPIAKVTALSFFDPSVYPSFDIHSGSSEETINAPA